MTESNPTETSAGDFAEFEKQALAGDAPLAAETTETAPVEEQTETAEVAEAETAPVEEQTETDEEKTRSANRFTKQTRELREAERRLKALEAELEALKTPKPLTPPAEPDNNAASGPPDPAKYQYGELDPQYVSDLADFRAELKIKSFKDELRQEREAQQREEAAQREVAARREKADKISNDGSSKYSDFDATVVPWAESQDPAKMLAVFEAAAETSVGAEIFYHLAKNPQDADHVMSLAPMQQMRWMAQFEARHSTPQPKKVSGAPAPINTARGSSGQFAPNPATMDFATFERMAMNSKG